MLGRAFVILLPKHPTFQVTASGCRDGQDVCCLVVQGHGEGLSLPLCASSDLIAVVVVVAAAAGRPKHSEIPILEMDSHRVLAA